MVAVTTCNVTTVNMIFAGCVLEIGKHMVASIMSVHDTKKIQTLHMRVFTHKRGKLSRNIFTITSE